MISFFAMCSLTVRNYTEGIHKICDRNYRLFGLIPNFCCIAFLLYISTFVLRDKKITNCGFHVSVSAIAIGNTLRLHICKIALSKRY